MNILISGVGGPTPRSIARSIRFFSKFDKALIVGTDINGYAYGLYEKDLYDHTYVIPPANARNYWGKVEHLIAKHKIDIALIHPEAEVLEWAKRAETHALPCKVLLPSYNLASMLTDKAKMTEALKGSGLVPDSFYILNGTTDFHELEKRLPYPFWIRSTAGSSGLGSLKVESTQALKNWLFINPNVEEFIASSFLPGRNLAVKLLYFNGKLVRAASAERVNYIMSKVAPSGITGNTSFGRLLNEPALVSEATRAMEILFKKTNAPKHGFFTADFKEDEEGKPFLTEVNVRMVAFNLSFAAGGANFTEDIIKLMSEDSFNNDYKMYKFTENFIFLRDVDAVPILMKEDDLFKKEEC